MRSLRETDSAQNMQAVGSADPLHGICSSFVALQDIKDVCMCECTQPLNPSNAQAIVKPYSLRIRPRCTWFPATPYCITIVVRGLNEAGAQVADWSDGIKYP